MLEYEQRIVFLNLDDKDVYNRMELQTVNQWMTNEPLKKNFFQRVQTIKHFFLKVDKYKYTHPSFDHWFLLNVFNVVIDKDKQFFIQIDQSIQASTDYQTVLKYMDYIPKSELVKLNSSIKKKSKVNYHKINPEKLLMFSVALFTFEFLFKCHPFQGTLYYDRFLFHHDYYIKFVLKHHLGFIFNDENNKPIHSFHKRALEVWNELDDDHIQASDLKTFFMKAFNFEFTSYDEMKSFYHNIKLGDKR